MNADTNGYQYCSINPSKGNVTWEMVPEMGGLSLDVQIPEEEKELGPQDRLIHVYHFTRDASQNHMVCSSPFFLCLFVVSNIKKNLF